MPHYESVHARRCLGGRVLATRTPARCALRVCMQEGRRLEWALFCRPSHQPFSASPAGRLHRDAKHVKKN
eukprot:8564597-Alexandrium_andersonii.AAC.1